MTKKFLVEVPCTGVDQYFIYADSESDARRKMTSGSMIGYTDANGGDYTLIGGAESEPETHWENAVIVEEVANA